MYSNTKIIEVSNEAIVNAISPSVMNDTNEFKILDTAIKTNAFKNQVFFMKNPIAAITNATAFITEKAKVKGKLYPAPKIENIRNRKMPCVRKPSPNMK